MIKPRIKGKYFKKNLSNDLAIKWSHNNGGSWFWWYSNALECALLDAQLGIYHA